MTGKAMGRPRTRPLPSFVGSPWEHQAQLGESQRHFDLFALFLELGPARTLAAVAERAGMKLSTMLELSSVYAWQARAAQADAQIEVETVNELVAGIAPMRARHAELAAGILERIGPMLLQQASAADLEPRDTRALAELALKYERLSRGLGDRVDVHAEVRLSGSVTVDALARVVVTALQPYPEARAAVESALVALDRQPAGQHRSIQGSVI